VQIGKKYRHFAGGVPVTGLENVVLMLVTIKRGKITFFSEVGANNQQVVYFKVLCFTRKKLKLFENRMTFQFRLFQ